MQRLQAGVRDGAINPEYGTLAVQGRLLAERCQKFTPPLGKKGSSDSAAMDAGYTAVAVDITRIYCPQDESTYAKKSMQRIVRNDDREAWNAASARFDAGHGLKNTKAVAFSTSLHAQSRDSRGRAYGTANGARLAKQNLGYVTLGQQGRLAREFIKQQQAKVGWARAGWNAGILGLGGDPPKAWIVRHGTVGGTLVQGGGDDPYIKVSNNTGWADYDGARIVRNALATRIRDIEAYATRMCELARDKAGLAAAA